MKVILKRKGHPELSFSKPLQATPMPGSPVPVLAVPDLQSLVKRQGLRSLTYVNLSFTTKLYGIEDRSTVSGEMPMDRNLKKKSTDIVELSTVSGQQATFIEDASMGLEEQSTVLVKVTTELEVQSTASVLGLRSGSQTNISLVNSVNDSVVGGQCIPVHKTQRFLNLSLKDGRQCLTYVLGNPEETDGRTVLGQGEGSKGKIDMDRATLDVENLGVLIISEYGIDENNMSLVHFQGYRLTSKFSRFNHKSGGSDNICKEAWTIIKPNTSDPVATTSNISLKLGSVFVNNELEVGNILNKQFATTVMHLSENQVEPKLPVDMPARLPYPLLTLTAVRPAEIIEDIQLLENKNSSGLDKISNKLLKACSQHISPVWTNVRERVLGVMMDISKAFDYVSHLKLLEVLWGLGLGDGAVRWLDSYLSQREQCVETMNQRSD
ncbi:hypothetical protein J6590_083543 [Homalodisca vitripennis]|nr:hypothetical protein J6590_083543 [Homalodisca vitripennis]